MNEVMSLLAAEERTGVLDYVTKTHLFSVADVVADRFRILAYLGAGGMGQVYKAEDTVLGGEIALKILHPAFASDSRFLELFRREIVLGRSITHPNVCRVHDFGVHNTMTSCGEAATALFTMELLNGFPLSRSLQGRALSESEALPYVRQMAAGLAAIHAAGVIHRDFKTGNVIVVQEEEALRAVITDFGLAHASPRANDNRTTSVAGQFVGTPAYMAPEQVSGGLVDRRADIFAFGVVMYELLTGKMPFTGDTPLQIALKRLTEDPAPPRQFARSLSPQWERVIMLCLKRNPEERFADVSEITKALTGTNVDVSRYLDFPAAICPFRGLEAFRIEDAEFFAGREQVCSRILDRMSERDLIAVVGSSGSGKSSVIQAGVLASLSKSVPWGGTLAKLMFRPGEVPSRSLKSAILQNLRSMPDERLSRDEHPGIGPQDTPKESLLNLLSDLLHKAQAQSLLMIIDQFEELFTLSDDSSRTSFLEILIAALNSLPVKVLIGLRADFFGHAISWDRRISDMLQSGTIILGPMTAGERKEAITVPAKRAKLYLEGGLVERIRNDLAEQPGDLPILQYALTELWNRRQGSLLTHAAYDEFGGVSGAIANRAEAIYRSLSNEERQVTRRLFTRLISVRDSGAEGGDTKCRISRSNLSHLSWAVIEKFAGQDFRLIVVAADFDSQEEFIEIAHEALIRRWKRLQSWLDEDREFLVWRQQLTPYLTHWLRSKRDSGMLLKGVVLVEAVRWLRSHPDDLNDKERELITASQEAVRKTARFRRILFASAVAASVLMIFSFFYVRTQGYVVSSIQRDAIYRRHLGADVRLAPVEPDPAQKYLAALVFCGRLDEVLSDTINLPDELRVASEAQALAETGQLQLALDIVDRYVPSDWRPRVLIGLVQSLERTRQQTDADKLLANILTLVRQSSYRNKFPDLLYLAGEFDARDQQAITSELLKSAERELAEIKDPKRQAGSAQFLSSFAMRINGLDPESENRLSTAGAYEIIAAADLIAGRRHNTQALRLAHLAASRVEGLDDRSKMYLLVSVARTLARLRQAEESAKALELARAAAQRMKSPGERDATLASVAQIFLNAGSTERAEAAADEMGDTILKVKTLNTIAGRLSASGNAEAGETVIVNSLKVANRISTAEEIPLTADFGALRRTESMIDSRCGALAEIAVACVRSKWPSEGERILERVSSCIPNVSDVMFKSQVYYLRAKALASLGRFPEATRTARMCTVEKDKLNANTAILLEIAKARRPTLDKTFDSWQPTPTPYDF